MTSATPRCRCPRPVSAPQDLEKAFAKNHQDHHPNPDPREGVARRESCSDKETHLAAAAVVAEDRLTGRPASVPSCTGVGIQLSKRPDRTVRFFFSPSVRASTMTRGDLMASGKWGPRVSRRRRTLSVWEALCRTRGVAGWLQGPARTRRKDARGPAAAPGRVHVRHSLWSGL